MRTIRLHLLEGMALAGLVATAISGAAYYVSPTGYARLVREDGLVEWITAGALLFTAAVLANRAGQQWRQGMGRAAALHVLLAAGLIFGFGEEISWGQRLFSVESGAFFSTYNLQGETNLHNLKIGAWELNRVIFTWGLGALFGAYFFAALPLYRRWDGFRRVVQRIQVPLPRPVHSWTLGALLLAVLPIPNERKWELWEAVFACCLLLVALRPYPLGNQPGKRA